MSDGSTRSKSKSATADMTVRRRGARTTSGPTAGSRAALEAQLLAVETQAELVTGQLSELQAVRESKSGVRLLFATVFLLAVGFGGYYLAQSLWIMAILPLLAMGLVVGLKLDHVVRWTRRLFEATAASARRHANAEGWWQKTRKAFVSGLDAIGRQTAKIRDPYLRAGVGGAATLYYGGGTVALGGAVVAGTLFLLYVVVAIAIMLAILAAVLAALGGD